MTTFARMLAALLGAAIAACSFLPWVVDRDAWALHIRSLLFPGDNAGVSAAVSVGLVLCVAAALVVLGALANSRPLVIIGGLGSVALPAIWILANAVSSAAGKIPISQIQVGAYAATVLGFMVLILAAVAADRRVPTLR